MYLCRGTILLKYFTLILVIIFLQTCNARKSKHYYSPLSACGHIRNISYPFRLNTDPEYCRYEPEFELACEGNQTVISLLSKKLYVQGINYDKQTIHLLDPTLQTQDDLCSLILPQFTFDTNYPVSYYDNSEPIFIFNCPFAVNNSTFLEISGCKLSRHTYLKIGYMETSEVSDGCRVQLIGLTSWPNIYDAENNISLSDFHQAILYGFDLTYSLKVGGCEERISGFQHILDQSVSTLLFHGYVSILSGFWTKDKDHSIAASVFHGVFGSKICDQPSISNCISGDQIQKKAFVYV